MIYYYILKHADKCRLIYSSNVIFSNAKNFLLQVFTNPKTIASIFKCLKCFDLPNSETFFQD